MRPDSSFGGEPPNRGEPAARRVGRYEITGTLGQGGMGIVYRAFDTLLQRDVALKLISGNLESGPEQRERFFREARAAGQLSHPHIITIYDLGEHDGQPYLAMELLRGEDLATRLAGPNRMSVAHKVDVVMQICDGLEYAHGRGVVHRDMKPANVFLTETGTAKILDFGLARLVTSELTDSNMMMGTVNYMAPEQVRGERADRRSDIFAVGVLCYELLGGRKAFDADSVAATLYKILQDEPQPLATLDPSLPPDLIAIVNRALAKARDERYQQMADMLRDLAVYRQTLLAREPGSGGRLLSQTTAVIPPDLVDRGGGGSGAPGSAAPASGGGVPPRSASHEVAGVPGSGSHASGASRARLRVWLPAAAVVMAVAGLGWWFRSTTASPPAATREARAAAAPVDRAAADAAIAAAQRALDAGDVAEAERQAAAALAADPGSADAQRLRDRAGAAAAAIARGMSDARAAYAAGRYDDATAAVGSVLAIAPGLPEARQLMQDVAATSRGHAASQARARMDEAKDAARAAGAARVAPAAYQAALDAERAARGLEASGRAADATVKFYEASGLFRSAGLTASAAAARGTTPATNAPPAPRTAAGESSAGARRDAAASAAAPAPPSSTAPQTAASPAAPPATGTPPAPIGVSGAPQSAPPSAPPAATPAAAGDRTPPPSPPVPAAVSPPKPAAPVTSAEPAEAAIADVLARYKAALEARSLDALKRLWPGLGGAQEAALLKEFQYATRISVEVVSPRIHVEGGAATATFVRRYELVTTDGQRLASASSTTMTLRRTPAGWVIDRLRFDPLR